MQNSDISATPLVSAALQPGVLPDGCNAGVMVRVLLIVNTVVALTLAIRAEDWQQFSNNFSSAAMLVEPTILASLLILCVLRRFISHWPAFIQIMLGCIVPSALIIILENLFNLQTVIYNPKEYWLSVFVTALVALILLHYFELRARAYSPALDEARIQALQARIRPHFLFNSLNAVLGVIRDNPRRAEQALEDLGDLFRLLMKDVREQVSVSAEIKLCRQYLAIEELRLGDRLQIYWEVDPAAELAAIPALLLQPLVENAVHHGVERRNQPSQIEIVIHKRGDRLNIRIANPLSPQIFSNTTDKVMQQMLNEQRHNHIALDNIRERLTLLYDIEAQIQTYKDADQFMVELNFPYRKL